MASLDTPVALRLTAAKAPGYAPLMGNDALRGRIAWVTGSSRGMGRVIARHLAAQGARVVVHGTTPTSSRAFDEADSLEEVARLMAAETGTDVRAVHGDLTDDARVGELATSIERDVGPIDVLVNCAGGDVGASGTTGPGGGKPAGNDAVNISIADLRAVLDRNLMACILPCRAVAPAMMARRAGRIINIGSISGLAGRASEAIYCTAKAGVHEYSRCLAALLRPYDVCVNVVAPGETVTPRFAATRALDAALDVKAGSLIRYGWPEDIAGVVAFLAGPASSYVTGQVLRVDGGGQLWPA
jgi:3-oxoacyl-[acyl-carrier protein] reductase